MFKEISSHNVKGTFVSASGVVSNKDFAISVVPGSISDDHVCAAGFANGNIFAAWVDSTDKQILGRILSPTGTPVTDPFAIRTGTGTFNTGQMDCVGSGNTISIVWDEISSSYRIVGNTVSSTGVVGALYTAKDFGTTPIAGLPTVAALPSGNIIIVAQTTADDILARTFSLTGTPVGGEVILNQDTTTENQGNPSVGVLNDGTMMAAWDKSSTLIQARRITSTGAAAGNEIAASTDGVFASVAGLGDGTVMVAWQQDNGLQNPQVSGNVYDTTGTLKTSFTLPVTLNGQGYPKIVPVGGDKVILFWTDDLVRANTVNTGVTTPTPTPTPTTGGTPTPTPTPTTGGTPTPTPTPTTGGTPTPTPTPTPTSPSSANSMAPNLVLGVAALGASIYNAYAELFSDAYNLVAGTYKDKTA